MEQRPPVLIQAAMDKEINCILDAVCVIGEIKIAGWRFYRAEIHGYPAVVSKTLIGMSAAAGATALALDRFKPLCIFNLGLAGSYREDIEPGDIVIGTRYVNYGAYDSPKKAAGEGFDIPGYAPRELELSDAGEAAYFLEADPGMLQSALSRREQYGKGRVLTGALGSGDAWNREADRIGCIRQCFGALSEDMETAACAQIARIFGVPFLGVRCISNNELTGQGYQPEVADGFQKFMLLVIEEYIQKHIK